MKSVGIVGGGISGLVAAWHLITREPGVEVTVFEADARVGGKLRQEDVAGHAVDVGAESALWRRPEVVDLLAELDVAAVHPQRFPALLWSRGRLEALPAGTLMGIPSAPRAAAGLLDADEVARALDERTVHLSTPFTHPPVAAGPMADSSAAVADISVGDAVEQALGSAVVDRMVEPLLGGVYAGHARELSARACVPALHAALLAGTPLTAAAAAASSAVSSSDPRQVFGAPIGGMGSLPATLRRALEDRGVRVVTDATVTGLRRALAHRRAWHLDVDVDSLPEPHEFDAIILTTPAAVTARLLAHVAPDAAHELSAVESASMAIVTYAFDADLTRRLPEGTGFLVPPVDGRTIKASTFSSVKWPWLAQTAPDVTYLRVSVGRHRDHALLDADDAMLVRAGLNDLEAALGIALPQPLDTHVQRWRDGLPQYALGHVERVERAERALASLPGLAIAGAALHGVGIPACVAGARDAAAHVMQHLVASDGTNDVPDAPEQPTQPDPPGEHDRHEPQPRTPRQGGGR